MNKTRRQVELERFGALGSDGIARTVIVTEIEVTEELLNGDHCHYRQHRTYETDRREHVNVDESTGVMSLTSGVTLSRLPS